MMYNTINSDFANKNVVIYGRVSTEHEAQLSALENQLDWYKPILATRPNWNLINTYVDEGITGTSAEKRPQFLKMIRDAKQKKFDMIITREVSRFARNTVDTLQYTRELKQHGVEVFFINDNIKTFDGDGELRLTIMATLAQDESRKTSIRVKSGQQTSMDNGVFYGNGNILGYDRVGKDMVINPEQAKTVKMMFDMYLNGYGLQAIKYELEKQHRKTAMGKEKWFCSVISKTLQNTFYCGIITYHKEYTPDYLTQVKIPNHGEIEKTQTQGRHEPIVSVEDFEKVQQMLNSKRRTMKNLNTWENKGVNPTKILWCKLMVCECGNHFVRRVWSRTDGITSFGYYCFTSSNLGTEKTRKNKGLSLKGICKTPMIPEWKLKMMAKYIFKNYILDSTEIVSIARQYLEKHLTDKIDIEDNTEIIQGKEYEVEKVKRLINNYIEMRAEGDISKEVFREKTSELEERLARLENEIEELNKQEEERIADDGWELHFEDLKSTLESYVDFGDELDVPESIVEGFIEKIVVGQDSFDWYLRIKSDNKKVEEVQKLASFTINLEQAKEYLYKFSTRKRVHKWHDITVNLWF